MNRVSLYKEFRLIERSEADVSSVWKGAHLLLFFMAFVFGSFCTFCFHMLMYLFDEKCVLFPKLQSLTALKHSVVHEFIPMKVDTADMLPVDFLSSQWVEKSACYLPTYVPLLSGIFGLVWTTMFLMCSTGSRTLTGLQRPWRVLPPVFVFSVAMAALSIYSSAVTDYGLYELCIKLGEITGSSTCSYTVNVLTLAYERRIRGVYQAIRLTITAAWLHTVCWILSAALALTRVVLAVDFQLVRVNVELIGDIDKMLERHETQIQTVYPEVWYNDEIASQTSSVLPTHTASKVHFTDANTLTNDENLAEIFYNGDALYISAVPQTLSEESLVPIEKHKLARLAAYEKMPKEHRFIVKMVYDLILALDLPSSESESLSNESLEYSSSDSRILEVVRQYGRERLDRDSFVSVHTTKYSKKSELTEQDTDDNTAEEEAKSMKKYLQNKFNEHLFEYFTRAKAAIKALPQASTSKRKDETPFESTLNITEEMKRIIESHVNQQEQQSTSEIDKPTEEKTVKKSNLKHASVQTYKRHRKTRSPKVQITEPEVLDQPLGTTDTAENTETPDTAGNTDTAGNPDIAGPSIATGSTGTTHDADKETQTTQKKEKQD